MNHSTKNSRQLVDGSALIWGLIFLATATLGLIRGLGFAIDWPLVGIITPVALIALGITGLALNRFQAR